MTEQHDVLVIDDLREFDFPACYARSSADGLRLLDRSWKQIWLDHDLGGDDTIMVVVDELCRRSFEGRPVSVTEVLVHTSNPGAGDTMMRTLRRYGYNVHRVDAARHQCR